MFGSLWSYGSMLCGSMLTLGAGVSEPSDDRIEQEMESWFGAAPAKTQLSYQTRDTSGQN